MEASGVIAADDNRTGTKDRKAERQESRKAGKQKGRKVEV
jgi:hypothetical protein